MSKALTPDKLAAFAKAVEQAAHKHLGENGVSSIAVGLNRDVYFESCASVFMSREAMETVDFSRAIGDVLPFFGGFIAVVEANTFGELTERLKVRK